MTTQPDYEQWDRYCDAIGFECAGCWEQVEYVTKEHLCDACETKNRYSDSYGEA